MTGPNCRLPSWLRVLFGLLTGLLFVGVASVLLSAPPFPGSLLQRAAPVPPLAGLTNPVTAVLLAFRGYDTLLEIHVLLLAVLGIWSFGTRPEPPALLPVNEILATLVRVLVPLLVLTAAYLVWRGAAASGGAFPAGALLAGAGVLLALTGRSLLAMQPAWLLRAGLALGPVLFVLIGLAAVAAGFPLLRYPPAHASWLLVLIEATAALSIGLALAIMPAGGRPRDHATDKERPDSGFRKP